MAGRAVDRVVGPFDPARIAGMVRLVIGVILAAFGINAIGYVVEAAMPVAVTAAAVACLLALLALQLYLAEPRAQRSRWALVALAAQAALVYVPLVVVPDAWTGMLGFLAGSVPLVLPAAAAWPIFAAVVTSGIVAQHLLAGDPISDAYIAANVVLVGLVVFGLCRLRALATELQDTRTALAESAITRQRLQFAADLRELLGRRLSAITVKAELGRRLATTAPEDARRELGEIIDVARDALADVRSIAGSYRAISLDDELVSVRSGLSAAGVAVTVRRDRGELPSEVGTALAIALREGVTAVLHRGTPRHCTIDLAVGAGGATLTISSDGWAGALPEFGDLAQRIEAMAGTLSISSDDGRLRVQVPVVATAPARPAAPAGPGHTIAPSMTLVILVGFAVAYLVTRMALLLYADLGIVGSVVAFGSALACVLLLVFVVRAPDSVAARAVLIPQAVLAFLPIVLFGDEVLGATGVVAAGVLLVLRPPAGMLGFAVVAVLAALLGAAYDGTWLGVSYPLLVTINNGLEWATLLSLYGLVSSLAAVRTEQAVLAVMKERLRFARDLHDMLGYSASAITLKAELARRLLDIDPERAGTELVEIADVARKAMEEIRSIARSPRVLALDEEVASARTLLAAADITVTVRVDAGMLPADVRAVLATVLREGITNVLRHSRAGHCAITISATAAAVTLEIVNDGVTAAGRGGGSGVENLAARVAELGGRLSSGEIADNAFRLHAHIPLVRLQEPAR